MLRRVLHVAWAATVVAVLALNVAFPLPGQEAARPWAAGLMAFPVAGALLLLRSRGNRIGMVLSTVGTSAGVIFIGMWAAVSYLDAPWSRYLETLASAAVVVQFWGIISLLYLFPDGSPPTRAGRWLYGAFTAWAGLMAVVGVIRPGPLDETGRANPLGLGPPDLATWFDIGIVGLPVGVAAGVAVLWQRRRRAGPLERTQLKWFLSASGLVVAVVAMIALVPEDGPQPAFVESLANVVVVAGFWALPAAIVAAVARYRLYDIDRLVSRSVTYGLVLGLLVTVYAGGLFLLTAWLPLPGDLAVAVVTLGVAALFNPVRTRVRVMVDRRFNRPRYDSAAEINRFAASLRHSWDLDELAASLAGVAAQTMHPSGASVWIRGGR